MPRSTPGSPERKGSTSSTASASSTTPRLPPRPTQPSLAPSPTLTEFGQLQPAAKDKAVGYATYTPGFKRGVATIEVQRTPPALPPRSATLGQSERGKSREPPSVPKKPLKPAPPRDPPRRPGAHRTAQPKRSASEAQPPNPPPLSRHLHRDHPNPQRRAAQVSHPPTQHGTTAKHRKSGSNVFTSISLSDEASSELRRTLETDVRAMCSCLRPRAGVHPPHRTAPLPHPRLRGVGELAHRYGCIGATAVQSVHTVGGGCKVTCRRCAVQAVWPESQRQHALGSERAAGPRGCGELDAHARRAARRCAQTCPCSRGAGMVEDAGSKRTRAIRCALYNHACRPGATPQACARGRKRVECIYTARKAAHGGRAGAARVVRVRRPTRGRYAHRRPSGRVGCGERATRGKRSRLPARFLARCGTTPCIWATMPSPPRPRLAARPSRAHSPQRCRARAQEVPPPATHCASQRCTRSCGERDRWTQSAAATARMMGEEQWKRAFMRPSAWLRQARLCRG